MPCAALLQQVCSLRGRFHLPVPQPSPHTAPPPLPSRCAQILPRVCPGGKTAELLVARGQRGGAKRSIGSVTSAEAVHPDGRSLHVSLQAAESTERPGRRVGQDGLRLKDAQPFCWVHPV